MTNSKRPSSLSLDRDEIQEYQQNRDPYLLIDYASEVFPGVSSVGYKDLRNDEWFFKVHWPGDPNMPGMLQVEALTQMGALSVLTLPGNKGKLVYLVEVEKAKFVKKIVPGDRLSIETEIASFNRGIGKCFGKGLVEDSLACSAEFRFIMPHIVSKYRVTKSKK
jgi:3-hydroxyacyl-[acyl-carrier-protein] dehydratase